MPLKLFSSKKAQNRLQKRRNGPASVYPSDSVLPGSQSTIRPQVWATSVERLSIASTLVLEPTASSQYQTNGPVHLASYGVYGTPTERASVTASRARQPRPLAQVRPAVVLPFPREPSNFLIPSIASASELHVASLSSDIWKRIADHASPADAANLALASKTLRYRLGAEPWKALDLPENEQHKIDVLVAMDGQLPDHLLCFLCRCYHVRLLPGNERLRSPNSHVLNPIYICPNVTEFVPPRTRLTHGRVLPFALVSLAMRANRYSPEHGISWTALSRRWKCRDSGWTHATRVYCYQGHLLLRSSSSCYASPNLTTSQERTLLYSRSDYAPYFSVCEHWQRGNLMRFCKCALSHVPEPPQSILTQLKKAPGVSFAKINPNQLPKQCDECKPMRRCPECPTEYLIEIKLMEDKNDNVNRFKHAICVTRWSDLGDGTSPNSHEWAACNGEKEYASFRAVKHATLSTIFETAVNNGAPTPKVLPLGRHGHVY